MRRSLTTTCERRRGAVGFQAHRGAVVLWVSDMPELNEQTRRRINQVSERIGVHRLVTIDAGFDREQLEPGTIHFINVQKLGTDKRLTRQEDGRSWPIWATFTNTSTRSRIASTWSSTRRIGFGGFLGTRGFASTLRRLRSAPCRMDCDATQPCLQALPSVELSPDPGDNPILATAIAGAADYLVVGDKRDLLALGKVEVVRIITARRLAELLGVSPAH
jgi:hypothetical protein